MPSVCNGSCGYTFLTNTPLLTSASIAGSVVTLSLTDPASLGYTLNEVTIDIGGQPCSVINPSDPISSFTCQLEQNSDSTAQVPTGSYMPIATISSFGQVPSDPSVTPFIFPLALTSLSITSGGTNGGYSMVLSGTGFPLSIT